MSPDLFRQIIARIASECSSPEMIQLFNWSEPLLNPDLPILVEEVKRVGLTCAVSSNLNVAPERIRNVVAAGVDSFRVSISGSRQESYGLTHVGGHVEVVKENMAILHDAVVSQASPPDVEVLYHLYTHNTGRELDEIAQMCGEFGFSLRTCWAYLMPVEKQLAYLNGELDESSKILVGRLAVRPDEARAVSAMQPGRGCALRDNQLVINTDGGVELCCATFDARSRLAESFLDCSWAGIAMAKLLSGTCRRCMKNSVNKTVLYAGSAEINKIALKRLSSEGNGAPTQMPSF